MGDGAVAIDVAKERLQILTTDCRIPRQRVSYVKNKARIPALSAGQSDSFVYQYGTPKHGKCLSGRYTILSRARG